MIIFQNRGENMKIKTLFVISMIMIIVCTTLGIVNGYTLLSVVNELAWIVIICACAFCIKYRS